MLYNDIGDRFGNTLSYLDKELSGIFAVDLASKGSL